MTDTAVLGDKVRDMISGLSGIAIAVTHQLSGNIQVGIAPEGEGKEIPKGGWIDIHQVERVGPGTLEVCPAEDTSHIVLGTKIEDSITGQTGIALERIIYMNGCTHIMMQPRIGKDDKIPGAMQLDWKRVKTIDASIHLATAVPPPISGSPKPPGGPSREMSARCL